LVRLVQRADVQTAKFSLSKAKRAGRFRQFLQML
jgi:hypothetical protein